MRDYNSILAYKKQGIIFNSEFKRWEYYGENPVIRGGEQQPEFVGKNYDDCIKYKNAAGRA